MALIFQFGSNCDVSRLNGDDRLRGDAKVIGIAQTVEDYQLAFDVWSTRVNCAAANIVRLPGSRVWGVLYEVPDHLIRRETARPRKSLDAIEGEGRNYERGCISVRRSDGQIVEALTYRTKAPQSGLRTSTDYVRHIVLGLREQGASEDYIREVKEIAKANNPEIGAGVDAL
jgi:cation transport regulator ChaC